MVISQVIKINPSEHEGYIMVIVKQLNGEKAKVHIKTEVIKFLAEQLEQPTQEDEE